jgi:3-oxoacyl-[acyl-carrier-protein] synthase III
MNNNQKSIGIIGVGTYIPPDIRPNSWWPESTVAKWRDKTASRLGKIKEYLKDDDSLAAKLTIQALEELKDDPFQGIKERRTTPENMKASDMETIAAREAIERAGINKDEIDMVLSHQICADYINLPSAAVVHGNLDLPKHCTTLSADASCNSFMMQLTLAMAMIRSGQAKYALLVQSSQFTRIPLSGELIDAWGGDAASAVVVGEVSEGRGVLSYTHHTDGKLWGALVLGSPGKRWMDDACTTYSEDPKANMNMVANICNRGGTVVREALTKAGLTPEQVDFYISHQAFKWLRPVSQAASGCTNAKHVDIFHYLGTASSVNLPIQLAVGEKEGLLKPGQLVACFQGGTGTTFSGMTMRWGR